MASKSLKNIISILAMANGIALVIRQQTRARTPTKLADKLHNACQDAFSLWPDSIKPRDFERIHQRLAGFEGANIPEEGRPELLTSIAMGLINDLHERIKDPVKRSALDRVEQALWGIHKYYDRNLDRFETYHLATRCVNRWWADEAA